MSSMSIRVALIGQPNVGKSTLFSRLTGVGVISSNYPGTTVEFEEAIVNYNGEEILFHDLPGTYSLSAVSDDEKVVSDMLNGGNDVIVVVADATDPESSIVLSSEVIELGIPTVIALNKYDVASKRMNIDVKKLEDILGVPVIPVSAKSGDGVDNVLKTISERKAKISSRQINYSENVVKLIETVSKECDIGNNAAVKVIEGIDRRFGEDLSEEIDSLYFKKHGEHICSRIAADRYADARMITDETFIRSSEGMTRSEKLSDMMIRPRTGIPILICVLAATFAILVFVGGLLATAVDELYVAIVGNIFSDIGRSIGGDLGATIMTGVDSSIRAVLGIVVPYIMVFYIVLGVLEDTGYLPRAVVLLDRIMRHIGLRGNGFIPIMVGFGCNVPAILATRTIISKRERLILCSLICMAIPCSAQTAIMTGVTGKYAGVGWILFIFAILFVLAIATGMFLDRTMKYEPSHLAMELPELQMPGVKNVLRKMWMRSKDFFVLAVPLLLVGSVIIELLIFYNVLDALVDPMSWLTVGMLGLPATTIICFIVGIVRKEMSYAMLMVVGALDIMDPSQFVVYGVVMSIYVPCLATIAAMKGELGWKHTTLVCITSMVIAVLIGTGVAQLFSLGLISA